MDNILSLIYEDVLQGNQKDIIRQVKAATRQGIPASTILNDAMIRAMSEVGRLFETGEYYIPEMLVAARAMQAGMNLIKPYLNEKESHPSGRIAIGTVKGDFHDIGKNLVKMMLGGAGFEIIDLGVDVDAAIFCSALFEQHVDLIAMSALITTTMPEMQIIIDQLESIGIRDRVKVMVGGAPVTEAFAHEIKADGYAPDASRAVAVAKSLLSK